jgi:hypothetical protein
MTATKMTTRVSASVRYERAIGQDGLEMAAPENQHPVQALPPQRPHHPSAVTNAALEVRPGYRRPWLHVPQVIAR